MFDRLELVILTHLFDDVVCLEGALLLGECVGEGTTTCEGLGSTSASDTHVSIASHMIAVTPCQHKLTHT